VFIIPSCLQREAARSEGLLCPAALPCLACSLAATQLV
jgi:hypothetical protein